jgi:hypothetical protein
VASARHTAAEKGIIAWSIVRNSANNKSAPLPVAWSIEEASRVLFSPFLAVYFEDEPGRRPAARLLSKDEYRQAAGATEKALN